MILRNATTVIVFFEFLTNVVVGCTGKGCLCTTNDSQGDAKPASGKVPVHVQTQNDQSDLQRIAFPITRCWKNFDFADFAMGSARGPGNAHTPLTLKASIPRLKVLASW